MNIKLAPGGDLDSYLKTVPTTPGCSGDETIFLKC